MAGHGTVLTKGEISQVASSAGFAGESLRIAVAVALAESSGNSAVVNSLGCVGLWQIYQKMHPEYSTLELKIPAKNAQAAFKISKGGKDWSPWTTYTSGAYKSHMDAADEAVGNQEAGEANADAVVAAVNPLSGLDQLTKVVRDSSLTFLVVFVALVLIILGIVLLARKPIGTVVAGMPAGKALKLL